MVADKAWSWNIVIFEVIGSSYAHEARKLENIVCYGKFPENEVPSSVEKLRGKTPVKRNLKNVSACKMKFVSQF